MTLAVFSVDIFSAQSEREAPYMHWLETENVSKSYLRSVDFLHKQLTAVLRAGDDCFLVDVTLSVTKL